MFGEILRKSIDPPLERAAAQLSAAGIRSGWLIVSSLVLGIGATALLAKHGYIFGLVVFALSRICGLLGSSSPRDASLQKNAYFGFAFDLIVYGLLAFGFALGDPTRALAAAFLMLGLVVLASSTLAFVWGTPATCGQSAATLAGATFFAAFSLACIDPDLFSVLAYAGGLASFTTSGAYIAAALVRTGQS